MYANPPISTISRALRRLARTGGAALLGWMMFAGLPAHAQPGSWGVGGHLATYALPGRYPLTFPNRIENYNFIDESQPSGGDPNSEEPKRDLDPNGNPLYHGLSRVKAQIYFGGDAIYYIDRQNRIGGTGQFGLGRRFLDMSLMARYDRVYARKDQFEFLIGGSLGVGAMRFKGSTGPEKLNVSYFPARGHIAGLFRSSSSAFQLSLFGQAAIPSNQRYTRYNNITVENVGTAVALFSYLSAGIELTAFYGDFKPNRRKNQNRRNQANRPNQGAKAPPAQPPPNTRGGGSERGGSSRGGTSRSPERRR